MNWRDRRHRLAGVAALLGSAVATLLHRGIWLPYTSGSAASGEALFGFLAIMLASFGILLVVWSSKPRDGGSHGGERAAHGRKHRLKSGGRKSASPPEKRWIETAERKPAVFANGRITLATFLVMRARQAAA